MTSNENPMSTDRPPEDVAGATHVGRRRFLAGAGAAAPSGGATVTRGIYEDITRVADLTPLPNTARELRTLAVVSWPVPALQPVSPRSPRPFPTASPVR